MSFKLKKKVGIAPTLDRLMDDDFNVALELFLLASSVKKEVYGVFDSLFSFLKRYEKS
jgi:hypothetical protein